MVDFTRDVFAAQITTLGWRIGEFSYGTPEVRTWGADGRLIVGRYCSFGERIKIILGGNHRTDWVTTYPFSALDPAAHGIPGHPATRGDVVIGNDVWIGEGATIMSGVTIGDGACIAAGALVAKDVPPYCIAGGNPARVLRRRFDEGRIAALLAIAWWDWPAERIRAAYPLLLSGDIDGFIADAKAVPPPPAG